MKLKLGATSPGLPNRPGPWGAGGPAVGVDDTELPNMPLREGAALGVEDAVLPNRLPPGKEGVALGVDDVCWPKVKLEDGFGIADFSPKTGANDCELDCDVVNGLFTACLLAPALKVKPELDVSWPNVNEVEPAPGVELPNSKLSLFDPAPFV